MPSVPLPRADQPLPFHLPMLVENAPPTYRLFPLAARAYTVFSIPAPRADQDEPSQRTIRLAFTLPAVVKLPPTYRLPPIAAIAYAPPFTPLPTAYHWRSLVS